ncbi:MAG: hypothetical protein RBT87_02130 [bacterium]|jgi:hypothetical protein|nr:hypothetical protein [bacterium]
MNKFKELSNLIDNFGSQVEFWKRENPGLLEKIHCVNVEVCKGENGYRIDNAIVFNRNLRKLSETGPKYIIVADNPGMDEQKEENSCYLIGKAGQMTRNFFINNGLVTNFDKEVAVLNKTCIHTKSTVDLKKLKSFKHLIDETQIFMADIAVDMQKIFDSKLWVIGCSELKEKGIFAAYLKRLKERYENDAESHRDQLFFYPHFSYGNFQKNLNAVLSQQPELTVEKALVQAGIKINYSEVKK